jgi:hypothetical protein
MQRLQEVVLRTSTGPLRPLWKACYAALERVITACLRRASPQTTVYLGGSFGFGEPVYGLSDLDVIAVSPGHPAAIRLRWGRLVKLVPPLGHVARDVFVYGEDELRRAAAAPCMSSRETFLRRDDLHDEAGLTVRPGPFGATREWRLVAGPERRPPAAPDAQSRRLATWLELQFWWRFAFQAAARPDAPNVPFLCMKLIAEPARLWLWLVHDRALFARRDVLREAIVSLPAEREAYELALELEGTLPSCPAPPLGAALASFTRQSTLIAALMDDAARAAGERAVHLVGAGARPFPLLDWRALVAPALSAERFDVVDGHPADAAALARLAGTAVEPAPALHAGPLMVRPALEPGRAKLRAVQCAATDPVSFALVRGHTEARFPQAAGWSASDWARRAVEEHRVWLECGTSARLNGHGWLGAPAVTPHRMVAAARAALFLESIEGGEPELMLSADAVASRLDADPTDGAALRRAVEGLPAYR